MKRRTLSEVDLDIEILKHDLTDVTMRFAEQFAKLDKERRAIEIEAIRKEEGIDKPRCECFVHNYHIDSRFCPLHKVPRRKLVRKWEKPPHVYSKKGRRANGKSNG